MTIDVNKQIHILGSVDEYFTNAHQKFNGASWINVGKTPINQPNLARTDSTGYIHIFPTDISSHYKFNGSQWVAIGTMPYACGATAGITLGTDNNINILGGYANGTKHYVFNGSSWSSIGALPCIVESSVVERDYDKNINIIGGLDSMGQPRKHYILKASKWYEQDDIPSNLSSCGSLIYTDNKIHIIGGGGGNKNHLKVDIGYLKL